MNLATFKATLNSEGLLAEWAPPSVSQWGLYIFRNDHEILRIGETSSGCARIAGGFREPLRHVRNGKERKNYYAYSWRGEHANTSIEIDYFELTEDPFRDSHLRRALEAEITFQFRIQRRRWPTRMSEIHFLETFREDARLVEVATLVLTAYGLPYLSDA